MIIDILFGVSAILFTYSAIPQIKKLYTTKKADDISFTRQKFIFIALILTITACIISDLKFSTITNIIQLILVTIVMIQIKRYRNE